MKLIEAPDSLKKFRKTAWEFQQTFQTPLKNLEPFVTLIVSAGDIETAQLNVAEVVFEPKHLTSALRQYLIPGEFRRDRAFVAESRGEVQCLLLAALSDWLDFAFVPKPTKFAIYADHDEYVTFYAHRRGILNGLITALEAEDFERVPNWQRRF